MKLTSILLVLAASAPAGAKPSSSAQAEALFDDAKALMAQKKFGEACDKFDSSQKLDPAITTLINAADCREKNNQLATAWGLFLDVERQTRGDPGAKKLHELAQTRAKKLEPRISKLTIKIEPATTKLAGLEVKLNADPVLAGSYGTALPTDGGHYTVIATAPHYTAFKADVELGVEKDAKTIEIPKLDAEGAAKPLPTKPIEPVARVEPAPQPAGGVSRVDEPTQPSRTGAVVATVAAVALAGGGVGFELWGRSKLAAAKTEPDDMKQDALYHDANTRHYVAQGLGAAAIAAGGVAAWLWIRGGSSAHADTAMVVPAATSDGAGLAVTGRW
jgi:hypothetical protein